MAEQRAYEWRMRMVAGVVALAVAAVALWGMFYTPALPHRCSDFGSWRAAQAAFNAGARHLDGDGDGVACEALR